MTNKDISDMGKKWLTTKQKAEEEQVTPRTVLRRLKKGLYPGAYQSGEQGEWRFPVEQVHTMPENAEGIIDGHYRREAVLRHQDELRNAVKAWESQLWLPPPWRWDVACLEHVFYIDTNSQEQVGGATGYKLLSDLAGGEKSMGHFRHFNEGDVCWKVQEDGEVILELPVEYDDNYIYLKHHTQKSTAWPLFDEWKKQGGYYLQLCTSLLNRIEQDLQRAMAVKPGLSYWAVYHDAFCIENTRYRCESCGAYNANGARFCRACNLQLGWFCPILKGYETSTKNSDFSPLHIPGWGNVEESIMIDKFRDIVPAYKHISDKYKGHAMIDNILIAEKDTKSIEEQLRGELTSLKSQRVFQGKCPACKDY